MMGGAIRRLRDDRRGQALVEFAITTPLLLMLLLGIVDFARAWNVYQVLTDAGREGTRVAVVDNGASLDQVRAVIKNAASRAGIELTDADISVTEGAGRGDPTTVSVQYAHRLRFVGWVLGLVSGDQNLNINVVATMRRE